MPRVGLISDPAAPEQLARWLAGRVPGNLPELLDDEREWSAEVLVDPVAAGRSSGSRFDMCR